MTDHPEPDGAPDPDLLAAYYDGALDEQDERRRRIEAWLERHAETPADLDSLRTLWQETKPPEPSAEAWQRVLTGLGRTPRVPAEPVRARSQRWPAAAVAAAACVALLVWLAARLLQPAQGPDSLATRNEDPAQLVVFPVVSADEVVVLRIDSDDIASIVVGRLPVLGPLELAGPGEVVQLRAEPYARDQMVPQFREQPSRPMFYAPLEAEETPR